MELFLQRSKSIFPLKISLLWSSKSQMQTVSEGSPDYLLCTHEALFFIFRGILGGGISEQIGFYGPSFPACKTSMSTTATKRTSNT